MEIAKTIRSFAKIQLVIGIVLSIILPFIFSDLFKSGIVVLLFIVCGIYLSFFLTALLDGFATLTQNSERIARGFAESKDSDDNRSLDALNDRLNNK